MNLTRADGRSYRCIVEIGDDIGSSTLNLTILQPDKPVILELSFRQFVTDVTFSCRADANPSASQFTWSRNGSITPDAPSNLEVYRQQTTSSSITLAWQPGFYGGFQQTFSFQYCTNETPEPLDQECDLATHIAGTNHTLTSLKPYTWYEITLWAENIFGNSSTRTAMASTARVFITLDTSKGILAFSERTNTDPPIEELCFIIIRNRTECDFVNGTECIEPGTKVSIVPEEDPVVVTFGRGLCSEPDYPRVTSASRLTYFLTIILGVVGASGIILLFSLGLLFSIRHCMKKDKSGTESESRPSTGQMIDEDVLMNDIAPPAIDHHLRFVPACYNGPGGSNIHVILDPINAIVAPEDEKEDEAVEEEEEEEEMKDVLEVEEDDEEELSLATSTEVPDPQSMDNDGLIYYDRSHGTVNLQRNAPTRFKEDTIYASLDYDAIGALKKEEDILEASVTSTIRANEDESAKINRQRNNHPSQACENVPVRYVGPGRSTVNSFHDSTCFGEAVDISPTSQKVPDSQRMDGDGLIYIDISHQMAPHPRPALVRSRGDTVYAALDHDVMATRSRENIPPTSMITYSNTLLLDDEDDYVNLSKDATLPSTSNLTRTGKDGTQTFQDLYATITRKKQKDN
eukprot:XP_011679814.1 PREDICTED: uncharacterized protein LOC105445677 [Strongylocentrotus purpuratus]